MKCVAEILFRVLDADDIMRTKQTSKITFCAMMAALAVCVMLLSYFPYLTYAIPAIAGLFIMVLVIELDCKWAFAGYLTSTVLVFLLVEAESKLLYIFFLGYYPILKALVERIKKPVIEWPIKLICFIVSVLAVYFIYTNLYGVDMSDMGVLGKYGNVVLIVLGTFTFVIYDIAVSRMAMMYLRVLHSKISKILK